MLITKQSRFRHTLYSVGLVMILIAGIGIASATDVQPSHPPFKWMNEDTNPAVDVSFKEYRSCSTCGSSQNVPVIRLEVQEYDAPVAPLAILDAAPQESSPEGAQESDPIDPIKPRTAPTRDPYVEAFWQWRSAPCEPPLHGNYCVTFYDRSESGGEPFAPIVLREWDFSDGKLKNDGQLYFQHQFPAPGDYVVILRVSNQFNTSTLYGVVNVRW